MLSIFQNRNYYFREIVFSYFFYLLEMSLTECLLLIININVQSLLVKFEKNTLAFD